MTSNMDSYHCTLPSTTVQSNKSYSSMKTAALSRHKSWNTNWLEQVLILKVQLSNESSKYTLHLNSFFLTHCLQLSHPDQPTLNYSIWSEANYKPRLQERSVSHWPHVANNTQNSSENSLSSFRLNIHSYFLLLYSTNHVFHLISHIKIS